KADSPWRAVHVSTVTRSADPQWRSAKVQYPTFYDATGNEGQWLPRSEPAWKLRMLVSRQGVTNFSSDERILLFDGKLPQAGESVSLDQSFDRSGVKFTILGVGGEGRLFITNGLQRVMLPSNSRDRGPSTISNSQGFTRSWASDLPFALIEVLGML